MGVITVNQKATGASKVRFLKDFYGQRYNKALTKGVFVLTPNGKNISKDDKPTFKKGEMAKVQKSMFAALVKRGYVDILHNNIPVDTEAMKEDGFKDVKTK